MEQNREKTHFGHNMRALAEWRSTISMNFFFVVVSPSFKLKLIHQYICINTIYARKNNCKIFFHSSCARLLSLHIVVGRFYYLAFLICFFFLHSLCYESTRRDVCTINIHGGFGCRDCYHAAGLMNFQRVNGMERNIQQQHIEHTRMQY